MYGPTSTTNTVKITGFTMVIYPRLASNSLSSEEMQRVCFMAFLEHSCCFVHFLGNLSALVRQRLTTSTSAIYFLLKVVNHLCKCFPSPWLSIQLISAKICFGYFRIYEKLHLFSLRKRFAWTQLTCTWSSHTNSLLFFFLNFVKFCRIWPFLWKVPLPRGLTFATIRPKT